MDEFLDPDRLKHIVRTYSTFVPHPIKLDGETLNEQKPIWVEPKSQVTDEQHAAFYQWLTHRTDEKPLWHLHLSSDSPIQFHAILYCPQSNFELLGFGQIEHGVNLCAKRILVQDDCRDLLARVPAVPVRGRRFGRPAAQRLARDAAGSQAAAEAQAGPDEEGARSPGEPGRGTAGNVSRRFTSSSARSCGRGSARISRTASGSPS